MRRGEIWTTAGGIFPGLPGHVKVVIVGSDAVNILPLRLVIPLLDRKEMHLQIPWMVCVNAGGDLATADGLQVRSIPADALLEKVGAVSPEEFGLILKALRVVFEIEE